MSIFCTKITDTFLSNETEQNSFIRNEKKTRTFYGITIKIFYIILTIYTFHKTKVTNI